MNTGTEREQIGALLHPTYEASRTNAWLDRLLVTVMNGTWCHGIVVRHSVLLCNSVVSVMFYCVCTVTAIKFCAPTEGTARFRNFGLNPYIDDCCEEDTMKDTRYTRLILLCMLATGAFYALERLH